MKVESFNKVTEASYLTAGNAWSYREILRSYPKDLFEFNTIEEILASEWESEDDLDFVYLRSYRN